MGHEVNDSKDTMFCEMVVLQLHHQLILPKSKTHPGEMAIEIMEI
jgi:hypothetical protein